MPIYEFVCRECGTQFEHMQSFSAHGHPPCPNCQSMHVSRLLSKPAIHFKGSGWYITDSKSSSRQSANGDQPERNDKSEKASEKGAEKPAEKTGAKSSDSTGEGAGERAAPKTTPSDAPSASS